MNTPASIEATDTAKVAKASASDNAKIEIDQSTTTNVYVKNVIKKGVSSKKLKRKNNIDKLWAGLIDKFPSLINEMSEDVNTKGLEFVRTFFVKDSRTLLSGLEKEHFEYYTDKDPKLNAAISHLEHIGFIKDITPYNCPKFLMTEDFVDKLNLTYLNKSNQNTRD